VCVSCQSIPSLSSFSLSLFPAVCLTYRTSTHRVLPAQPCQRRHGACRPDLHHRRSLPADPCQRGLRGQRERQRDRETERERQRQRDREREGERKPALPTATRNWPIRRAPPSLPPCPPLSTRSQRERQRDRERETETDRDRQRDRETERQRDRESRPECWRTILSVLTLELLLQALLGNHSAIPAICISASKPVATAGVGDLPIFFGNAVYSVEIIGLVGEDVCHLCISLCVSLSVSVSASHLYFCVEARGNGGCRGPAYLLWQRRVLGRDHWPGG
jgi:hypothetical protein